MGPELSVVIPIFNEEESIYPLYEELNEVLISLKRTYEILFVDDSSTDNSFFNLNEIYNRDSNVKIIKFRSNFGQSAAMKAGFEHASGKIIITMDGDLQNDPHDIPHLINKMQQEDYDVVCGWRRDRNDPWMKRFVSKIANRIRSSLTGESIHDSGCTLRAYVSGSVKNLELYGELHRYIPAMLMWRGYHVGELETNHRKRTLGKSKYNWKRIIKGFLDLLIITFWQKYSVRPMHVFGSIGLFMSGIGSIIVLYLILMRLFYFEELMGRPLFIVAFFLIILGIQFVALGILADIMLKIYYRQNEHYNYLIETVIG